MILSETATYKGTFTASFTVLTRSAISSGVDTPALSVTVTTVAPFFSASFTAEITKSRSARVASRAQNSTSSQ
ncbi:MAG: hypothetical protein IJM94_05280 [Clostridia bacterium]|nr:hypothetical protein [Clostridia bacterium]